MATTKGKFIMTIDGTQIDEVLKKLLQKNVKLQFKNKIFKSGKLLLYKQNNYHLSILLHNDKRGSVRFEIPIPFQVESWLDDGIVYFDYRLATLAKRKEPLLQQLRGVEPAKNSKYYDSILEIVIQSDGSN